MTLRDHGRARRLDDLAPSGMRAAVQVTQHRTKAGVTSENQGCRVPTPRPKRAARMEHAAVDQYNRAHSVIGVIPVLVIACVAGLRIGVAVVITVQALARLRVLLDRTTFVLN